MIAGVLVGAAAGSLANSLWGPDDLGLQTFVRWVSRPIGQIFLRLLFVLVLPVVFSALALGVAGVGDLRRVGRMGLRTLVYTLVVSAIAVFIGIGLVNLLRPGEGLPADVRARLLEGAATRAETITRPAKAPRTGADFLVGIVPDNLVRAAAENDMLAVMFVALCFGIALVRVQTSGTEALRAALEGVYDISMHCIEAVIRLAPIGVAALLFTVTAELGMAVLLQLARYVGVVVLALALHQFVVYSLAVRFLGGMSPWTFFRGIQAAMVTAFSTASSNATLPTALRVAEENLHLPSTVSRFVLTIGSTANQNGTALFEGVTVLFLAQFYGVDLSFAQQTMVVCICILGGVGTAGVPAGSLPVIAMILGMVRVPVEGIGLVLGVDRFLDMCRTTLNVSGDLAAAVVVARGETRLHGARSENLPAEPDVVRHQR